MALSDHEKRVLDEIEDSLVVEDPRLASSLRNPRAVHGFRRVLLQTSGTLVGTALAIVGVHTNSVVGIIIALLGFGLVVTTTFVLWPSFSRSRGKRQD
jgi:hypothetical protein